VCDPGYAEQVATYQAAGLRSLATGDVLVARDEAGTRQSLAERLKEQIPA
jgi:hypothetical protein